MGNAEGGRSRISKEHAAGGNQRGNHKGHRSWSKRERNGIINISLPTVGDGTVYGEHGDAECEGRGREKDKDIGGGEERGGEEQVKEKDRVSQVRPDLGGTQFGQERTKKTNSQQVGGRRQRGRKLKGKKARSMR